MFVKDVSGTPTKVKSSNLSINIQGVPVDVPARTIKKKKRKEKRAEKKRRMQASYGGSKAVPSSVSTLDANEGLFSGPSGGSTDSPGASRRNSISKAEKRVSISEIQGEGPAPENYIPENKLLPNETFDGATSMDIVELRELYYEADEQTQEDIMEDIIDQIDKICHFASYDGVSPSDLLVDKDGAWDGTPEALVPDLTRLGWDLTHFADEVVDMDEDDERFYKVRMNAPMWLAVHSPLQTANPSSQRSSRRRTSSPCTHSGCVASESLGRSLQKSTRIYYAALG
jgi:hypothetical protein